jgi:PiT family inorganic phosphate transporter
MGLTLAFGFYMAWNIGANDVANAMGTSVGSGALTLRRAVIIAAIFEFAGAYFAGGAVANTIRKGIVDPEVFVNDPTLFVCGMLAALLAAGVWLQIASYFGWPVSTTHSIVGSVLGFGAVYAGLEAIHWDKVSLIAASWVISPILAGGISCFVFTVLLRQIFYKPDPLAAAKRITPILVFVVFTMYSLVFVFKGLKHKLKDVDLSLGESLLIACGIGLVAAIISAFLVRRVTDNVSEDDGGEGIEAGKASYIDRSLERAIKHVRRARHVGDAEIGTEASDLMERLEALSSTIKAKTTTKSTRPQYQSVERIFISLQIISAASLAFAHGSNDVANAIGPLAAAWETIQSGTVGTEASISGWFLALGGIGIIFGLATWGWRVIQTIGKKITELTPTRGFSAEFGAATTIVLASQMGLPISTTHTLVGAVLGVGLARGIGAINLNIVRDVFASWVVTIPAGAGLAIIFYYILAGIFT